MMVLTGEIKIRSEDKIKALKKALDNAVKTGAEVTLVTNGEWSPIKILAD
jgi:predicted type IV restriction endonuclease